MSKKIITGSFLRADGSPAAGDILTLLLSQDAASPDGQIVHAPIVLTLDVNGAIPADTEIYANDQLNPTGTYYAVSVVDGTYGEYYREHLVIAGTSPINLNTIAPAQQ